MQKDLHNAEHSNEGKPDLGIIRFFDDFSTEEELVAAIKERVDELLSSDPDLLFSYLYRLDIPKPHIERALYHSQPIEPSLALAHVILERQKVRISTKRNNPQKPIEGWDTF